MSKMNDYLNNRRQENQSRVDNELDKYRTAIVEYRFTPISIEKNAPKKYGEQVRRLREYIRSAYRSQGYVEKEKLVSYARTLGIEHLSDIDNIFHVLVPNGQMLEQSEVPDEPKTKPVQQPKNNAPQGKPLDTTVDKFFRDILIESDTDNQPKREPVDTNESEMAQYQSKNAPKVEETTHDTSKISVSYEGKDATDEDRETLSEINHALNQHQSRTEKHDEHRYPIVENQSRTINKPKKLSLWGKIKSIFK